MAVDTCEHDYITYYDIGTIQKHDVINFNV